MSDVWPLRRSPEGTRRDFRRDQELRLRLSGQYGPEWWEVFPVLLLVLVLVAAPLAALGWLWTRLGWWAALLGAAALGYVVRAALRRRRQALARRRHRAACFTLDQIDAAADDRALRSIVGRLLRRDGWQDVRGVRVTDAGVVHLVGHWPGGRRLGVAVERGVDGTGPEGPRGAGTLRSVGSGKDPVRAEPPPVYLVVSTGHYARSRVLWAARTGVHLVDRALLERWAAGEDLAVLLDLDLEGARPESA
ncbi:hypothetical protein ACFYUJ_37075 [Streptomyces sp. NPDC004520]|uniref:hypothetical protein n=1 Tax=Streptomyces sp. NPDC004520 TaxID=3364702 RepID=UPI003681C504